jgi:4'-phosphopantetheinyl transferase
LRNVEEHSIETPVRISCQINYVMATPLAWLTVTSPPALAENELHVWRASLDLPAAVFKRIEKTLDEQEKKRGERYLVPEARDCFVATRGILRALLGTYLDIDAGKVALNYGPHGKPFLSPAHNSDVCFSVSHSHRMALFVFARGHEVGVDIEWVEPNRRVMEIATHFFSEEETASLATLPPELAQQAFFGCWTRKEAYIKARGQGLSIPLRSFSVSFTESEQVVRDETGAAWGCYALEPGGGFAGAVVAAGENWRLKYCDWAQACGPSREGAAGASWGDSYSESKV